MIEETDTEQTESQQIGNKRNKIKIQNLKLKHANRQTDKQTKREQKQQQRFLFAVNVIGE